MSTLDHNDNETDIGTVTALWLSVLKQALEDATAYYLTGCRTPAQKERLRRDARDWLTKPNRDFVEVCNRAGLEPCKVRAFAIKLIAEADERQATGQAHRITTITYNGRTQTLYQWSEETGLEIATIRFRLNKGLTPEAILARISENRARKRRNTDTISTQAA